MKKLYLAVLCAVVLVLSASYISACGYQDHKDCKFLKTETIIEGQVTYGNEDPVRNAWVDITCSHEGTDYTQKVKTGKYGYYFTTFSQSQCITGDEVTAVASKKGLTGTGEGEVVDFITKKCLDLDIAIIDIPMVPEFGVLAGGLTILGAVGVFFFVRRK